VSLLPLTVRTPAHRVGCQVYVGGYCWFIAQSQLEVAGLQDDAIQSGASLFELTCATEGGWNGKPLFFDPHSVTIVTPPPWRDDE
jgi:hypothetical protein